MKKLLPLLALTSLLLATSCTTTRPLPPPNAYQPHPDPRIKHSEPWPSRVR